MKAPGQHPFFVRPLLSILKAGVLLFYLFAWGLASYGQSDPSRREILANRVEEGVIELDGKPLEPEWRKYKPASDFVQYEPSPGEPSRVKTEVILLYSDEAIYVAGFLYDNSPDSILRELCERDEFGNTDAFGVEINPFDDGQNAFNFRVSAANVQMDYKSSPSFTDYLWNAVWESEIGFWGQGWFVEIRIPYSSLRFPNSPEQVWGINFYRNLRRAREGSFWNPVDKAKGSIASQAGLLREIRNIRPPLRLSFNPYVSGYLNHDSESGGGERYLSGGLDFKLGLSESFTLDMTLIPDFGQARSDQKVLNLSPFEVYFDENREFFNEGTELFNKAGLFYSRRVGGRPMLYGKVDGFLGDHEVVESNPEKTALINATKISGRTKGKLGIGVFNGLTQSAFATIRDTLTGRKRKVMTETLSNYNLLVLDQSFGRNSYLNLTHSHVYRPEWGSRAQVAGSVFRLMDKENRNGVDGGLFYSSRRDSADQPFKSGAKGLLTFGRLNGKVILNTEFYFLSKDYNPNDLGFLERANQMILSFHSGYRWFEPFGSFLNLQVYANYWREYLQSPSVFVEEGGHFEYYATFRNHLSLGGQTTFSPGSAKDYFEPRQEGRFYLRPAYFQTGAWASTDYRKRLALDLNGHFFQNRAGSYSWSIGLSPRFRVNDRMMMVWESSYEPSIKDIGFLSSDGDQIYFAMRDIFTWVNSVSVNYIFSNKASFGIFFRHYWSRVDFGELEEGYFLLGLDGSLQDSEISPESDYSQGFFSLDVNYSWNFAPGSYFSVVWKNDISYSRTGQVSSDLLQEIERTLGAPQWNSLSFRLTYFIDYQKLKDRLAFSRGKTENTKGMGRAPGSYLHRRMSRGVNFTSRTL